jgi:hypothetical protein
MVSLSKPQYTLTLSPDEVQIIQAALLELPAKTSYNTIRVLVEQIVAQERPPQIAPFVAKDENCTNPALAAGAP